MAAVAGALEAGMTMVGVRVELDEVSPSPVGADLEVDAVLKRVAGRRLMVTVGVRDGDRPIACGRVTWPRCASAEVFSGAVGR